MDFCDVPTGYRYSDCGSVIYERCGQEAKYIVGNWYVCEKHKEHYTDIKKWPAERIDDAKEEE
jgi:hypothetical protein